MAVYLKVVASSSARSGGSHTLSGQECLVFYLGGSPNSSPKHAGGVNVLLGDGSVRFARDLDEIVAALRNEGSAGKTIIIGPASQTGFYSTRWELAPGSKQVPSLGLTSAGGQVVMIALLLPAVQAAREAAKRKAPTAPLLQLKSIVGTGGHVYVIGSESELLAV